jgi:endonuclease YncB( thermonuclease family)
MSTLTEQIDRIIQAKEDLKQAINEKGVTVADNALIDEYDDAVKAIEVGGGSSSGGTIIKSRVLWGR